MSEIKTPKYWDTMDWLKEKITVKTAYGHEVKIPKKFENGWEWASLRMEDVIKRGLAPTDGLQELEKVNPLSFDLERVFYEIYEED